MDIEELRVMLLHDFVTGILNEGGKTFSDTSPVSLDALEATWPMLKDDLHVMGVTDIQPVGTTFKKPVMGDIDLAVKYAAGKDELMSAASGLLGHDSVKKSGGDVVSIRYPVNDKRGRGTGEFMQVDLMVGDPRFISWGRFGPSPIKGHEDYSPVKGLVRNILFAVINRYAAERVFPGKTTKLDRVKYAIDFDKGLFKVTQTLRNKTPDKPPLKNWRTVSSELVSNDPDEIVKLMFGSDVTPADVRTFEGTVKALRESPTLGDIAEEILETFAVEMREKANLLGANAEEQLAHIEDVVFTTQESQSPMHLTETVEVVSESLSPPDAYEKSVIRAISVAGISGKIKKVTGANSVLPDADFVVYDEIYNLEVKMSSQAQMGGGSIGWKPTAGFYPTGKGAEQMLQPIADVLNAQPEMSVAAEALIAFMNKRMREEGFERQYDSFPFSTVHKPIWNEAVEAGLVAPLNRKRLPGDVQFIFEHYARKNTFYIQIGGSGLFYLANNPANLPVPQLSGNVFIEVRPARSGPPSRSVLIRAQARLYSTGTSPFTMDVPDSINKMLATMKKR